MTIVDIGYIQSFGSFCNAIGALAVGQVYYEYFGWKKIFLNCTKRLTKAIVVATELV